MSDVCKISDQQVKQMMGKIIRDVALSGQRFDYIAGVTRGGLVPANMLSQYYELPLITINWSLRDHARTDSAAVEQIADLCVQGKRVLLVDDICDEGDTLEAIWENVVLLADEHAERNFPSAVLVHNLGGTRFVPDFVGMEINKSELPMWLEFPWETWWQS